MQRTSDPTVTTEATEIIVKILDNKYKKANLEEIYQSSHQLYAKEKVILLHLLKDFEYIFDGRLGKWNTYPVEIKIKTNNRP